MTKPCHVDRTLSELPQRHGRECIARGRARANCDIYWKSPQEIQTQRGQHTMNPFLGASSISRSVKRFLPLVLVAGFGALVFMLSWRVADELATALSHGIVASTLVAVTWYTIETRGLRIQQQMDSEIRIHPWLRCSHLSVTHDMHEGGVIGRSTIDLPITNVGLTPAQDLYIKVCWELKGGNPAQHTQQVGPISLAPSDTHHQKLCQIDFDTPDDRVTIDVEVQYRSSMGGGGHLKMNFFSHEGGWANGPMAPYQFWLSDGRRFPAQTSLPKSS